MHSKVRIFPWARFGDFKEKESFVLPETFVREDSSLKGRRCKSKDRVVECAKELQKRYFPAFSHAYSSFEERIRRHSRVANTTTRMQRAPCMVPLSPLAIPIGTRECRPQRLD